MAVTAFLPHLPEISTKFPHVAIIGVGDEGNDIVSRVFENGASGAQCIAVNINEDPLVRVYCHEKIVIESQATDDSEPSRWGEPEGKIIRACAESIGPSLAGADVAFIIVESGEARTRAVASATAEVARRSDALAVGVAIMPPFFERERRLAACHELASMRRSCHTLAIVDPSRAIALPAYLPNLCDDPSERLVVDMVAGLSETLACPSILNIDFAAFRGLITHGGIAHIGIARSSSALRVEEATAGALRGPLLYDNIAQSQGALVNVRGDVTLTNEEAERAAELVAERAGSPMPVVVGAHADDSWYDGCQVSVWLTGGRYPYIPGGYRRLPLDMYEMEPDEEEGPIDLDLDLDQLEEA